MSNSDLEPGLRGPSYEEEKFGPVAAQAHVASQPIRRARDKAQYVRQQKGHSLLLHLFIIGPFTLWIPAIYYTVSPNHFWHA